MTPSAFLTMSLVSSTINRKLTGKTSYELLPFMNVRMLVKAASWETNWSGLTDELARKRGRGVDEDDGRRGLAGVREEDELAGGGSGDAGGFGDAMGRSRRSEHR